MEVRNRGNVLTESDTAEGSAERMVCVSRANSVRPHEACYTIDLTVDWLKYISPLKAFWSQRKLSRVPADFSSSQVKLEPVLFYTVKTYRLRRGKTAYNSTLGITRRCVISFTPRPFYYLDTPVSIQQGVCSVSEASECFGEKLTFICLDSTREHPPRSPVL